MVVASSNEGDIVLDPFCGCGTTIAAAQKLNRQWIGIDITHLSIALQKYRLKDAFGLDPVGSKTLSSSLKGTKIIAQGKDEVRHPGKRSNSDSDPEGVEQNKPVAPLQGAETMMDVSPGFHPGLLSLSPTATGKNYKIIGEPEDLESAKQLATEDRYQFQWWALSLIKARPQGGSGTSKEGKKGSDKGIDGTMVFVDDTSGKAKRVIVEVKSGHVRSEHIRSLAGVVDREYAAIGIFITLEKPSRDMTTEAVGKGFYHSDGWGKDYPKLQILTIEELLNGKQPDMPPSSITFKQAERMGSENKDQGMLGFWDSEGEAKPRGVF